MWKGSLVERFDLAVVGAGIVGLAHALAASRRGLRVVVVERSARAVGASVRNFGMVWPIGQPPGPLLTRALRSRELWLECAAGAGFGAEQCGAMHVAQEPDELALLEEFVTLHGEAGYGARLLTGDQACAACPGLRRGRVVGAMHTDRELCVNPREAIRSLPSFLEREHNVQFRFATAVKHVDSAFVACAAGGDVRADRIVVCSGPEMELLFPDILRDGGVVKCKLQMMRTAPQPEGWRIGSHLAAGLTLLHYSAFSSCAALPALRARMQEQYAEHIAAGVHVLISQNAAGELTIGDSHQYGEDIEPFDSERIDSLILEYTRTFFDAPRLEIAERWHGVYAKHMRGATELVARPMPGVFVVNGLGGMGMTLSLGLAEETVESILADRVWSPPQAASV